MATMATIANTPASFYCTKPRDNLYAKTAPPNNEKNIVDAANILTRKKALFKSLAVTWAQANEAQSAAI